MDERIDILKKSIAYLQDSSRAEYAIRLVHSHVSSIINNERQSSRYPVLFTSIRVDDTYQELQFTCCYWGKKAHKEAFKKCDLYHEDRWIDYKPELTRCVHQLYCILVCRGFHVQHVRDQVLPRFNDVYYEEHRYNTVCDEIVIHNIVFHDTEKDPAIMMLIKSEDITELYWVSFEMLNNYRAFVEYLHKRAITVPGTTKFFGAICV